MTGTAEDIVGVLRQHAQELRRAGLRHLSLFGSVARGEATAHSDVDIAAVMDPAARIGLIGLSALQQHLSQLVGRAVDLVPEPVEAPRLKANIERDRIRIF